MSASDMEYSIQEVSELLGIPIQKLRRWDEQGVLVALRTAGGHRRYAKELIDRLAASGLNATADKASQELATVKRALAEKRRIIQLLLESENRYRDLVETSHDLIWATDAQGRFTYLNTAANDIFGLAPKDLIGRCFFDFEAGAAHLEPSFSRPPEEERRSKKLCHARSDSRTRRPLDRYQCAPDPRRQWRGSGHPRHRPRHHRAAPRVPTDRASRAARFTHGPAEPAQLAKPH